MSWIESGIAAIITGAALITQSQLTAWRDRKAAAEQHDRDAADAVLARRTEVHRDALEALNVCLARTQALYAAANAGERRSPEKIPSLDQVSAAHAHLAMYASKDSADDYWKARESMDRALFSIRQFKWGALPGDRDRLSAVMSMWSALHTATEDRDAYVTTARSDLAMLREPAGAAARPPRRGPLARWTGRGRSAQP